jgi:hypothetical protein
MPFVYKRKPANIDRSVKRNDNEIHSAVLDSLGNTPRRILLLPVYYVNPPRDKADAKAYFALNLVKNFDLTWFEVEHWLDQISRSDRYMFQLENECAMFVDERRRCYMRKEPMQGDVIKCSIIYKPDENSRIIQGSISPAP